MKVSKKDRIAIVISIVYVFITLCIMASSDVESVLLLIIPIGYWGYRFIKNDISFIKIKE